MAIAFGADRWQHVRETYHQWWSGTLNRPVIPVELYGRDPGRPRPAAPLLTQATCADLSIPADALIDRLDWELAQRIYLGDAFPAVGMECFGPGVAAAFIGARLDNSTGGVWFHPPSDCPIHDIHFHYDPDNQWLRRVKEICAAGIRRWQGQVLIGMTDLGGVVDVLSTFRPGEQLLMDLYDYPDEVKRLTWEAHDLWHRFYRDINDTLQPLNPGYSDWSRIYSDRPFSMLQCDFSYMIGPAMFEEFVKPELDASCRKLDRSFYHLDGPGELPHLDSLVQIQHLGGVQWVPSPGDTNAHWPLIARKVHAAGKRIQVLRGGFESIDLIMQTIGTGRGIQHSTIGAPLDVESEIRRRLARYGIR